MDLTDFTFQRTKLNNTFLPFPLWGKKKEAQDISMKKVTECKICGCINGPEVQNKRGNVCP